MQVKPYKPVKIGKVTYASEEEEKQNKDYTLDAYNQAAGIQPRKNPLQPYADVAAGKAVQNNSYTSANGTVNTGLSSQTTPTGGVKPSNLSSAQIAQMNSEGNFVENIVPDLTPKNAPKAQTVTPMSAENGGEEGDGSESGGNVLKPYSDIYEEDLYQKMLDEANGLYGGDFYAYDPSKLYGEELSKYYEWKNQLNANKIARDQYISEREAAEYQRDQQLQQAFINSELTKKYLPLYLKQQGLGGLGVSQSTLAQLQNDYSNNVNSINSNSDAVIRDLYGNYRDGYNSSRATMDATIGELEQSKKNREIEEALDYIDYMIEKVDSDELNFSQRYNLSKKIEENKEYMSKEKYEDYREKLGIFIYDDLTVITK